MEPMTELRLHLARYNLAAAIVLILEELVNDGISSRALHRADVELRSVAQLGAVQYDDPDVRTLRLALVDLVSEARSRDGVTSETAVRVRDIVRPWEARGRGRGISEGVSRG